MVRPVAEIVVEEGGVGGDDDIEALVAFGEEELQLIAVLGVGIVGLEDIAAPELFGLLRPLLDEDLGGADDDGEVQLGIIFRLGDHGQSGDRLAGAGAHFEDADALVRFPSGDGGDLVRPEVGRAVSRTGFADFPGSATLRGGYV